MTAASVLSSSYTVRASSEAIVDFNTFLTAVHAGFKALLREYETLRVKWVKTEEDNRLLYDIIKDHGLEKEVERRKKMEKKEKTD
ncbi:hypothetical protein PRZ48_005383 [Zasmidium cellare]|uniref:Uncharacterized protein n=1 Tax=Zasmidium cellare TaxID=395010 RepID=A0ABR0ES93_ZASCE|nr:hypothetical protein PRZ48_005383 [Zasmidium cellare]